MKIIHYINSISFIITLLLYITLIYGLIAQIFLGSIQVILAIILFAYWRKIKDIDKKHLAVYASLVVLFGLTCLTDILDTDFGIAYLMITPMSIAGYFVFITNQINKTK